MALLEEVILAVSSSESPIIAWDVQTGKTLATYKQSNSHRKSLCQVGESHFAATQALKSGGAIFTWQWNKSTPVFKSYPSEPIGPLVCTKDGSFIAGGGQSGTIHLWEVASGCLLRTWEAHLSAVSSLVLSDDDSVLVSGGVDGMVNAWSLARVLDKSFGVSDGMETKSVQPMYSIRDHTQPITGLYVGIGGSSAYLISSSSDRNCKVYSLGTGTLLRSIVFPVAMNTAVLDTAEYSFYGGGSDGRIFITPLVATSLEDPVLGAVQNDSVLEGHKKAITALTFSLDGVKLVSASEDGTVCLWCTASRKALRKYEHPHGPITAILLLPKPAALASQEDDHLRQTNRKAPGVPMGQLQKYPLGRESGDATSVWECPAVALPDCFQLDVTPPETDKGFPGTFSRAAMEKSIKELQEGNSVVSIQVVLEQKREELKRALDVADSWKDQFDQSFQIASDLLKHANDRKRDCGGRTKADVGGPTRTRDKGKSKSFPLDG